MAHQSYDVEIKRYLSVAFHEQKESNSSLHSKKIQELFPPPTQPIFLEWKNLSYDLHLKAKADPFSTANKTLSLQRFFSSGTYKRSVLNNLDGSVRPGEFLAILGPSGAGKTTLLNILAGRIKKGVSGEILVNGQPRYKVSQDPRDNHSCYAYLLCNQTDYR